MDRKKALSKESNELFNQLNKLHDELDSAFQNQYDRVLPSGDAFFDRWEKAKKLGFGEGTSVYDNALVIGKVSVGNDCWIGPNTIVDGSGELKIGNNCTISAAVHIYTHDNLKKTLSGGQLPIENAPVAIGKNTYIGPHSIISMGVTLGDQCVVAANSFVNKSFPKNSIVAGNPAKRIGEVIITEGNVHFDYSI